MGTEEIFPGRRHFERVAKKFQFLHARSWPFTRVRARAYGAFFFLKIDFLVQHMGKTHKSNGISLRSPSLIMAPGK